MGIVPATSFRCRRPEKRGFFLPGTGSGLGFMRRAGIQINPRSVKKREKGSYPGPGMVVQGSKSAPAFIFSKRVRISFGTSNSFSVNRREPFFLARSPGNDDFSDVLFSFSVKCANAYALAALSLCTGKGRLPLPGIRPDSLSFSSRLRYDNDAGATV